MIETVISGRKRSIGSMEVSRVLPFSKRRAIGPFVFLDQFGPIEIVSDQSMDVLPHPHIGLATVTYLLGGNMTHRDSIGTFQKIRPGEVNLMTSGAGIVHSERVSDAGNKNGDRLQGLQIWLALPEEGQEIAPSFSHHKNDELPVKAEADGTMVKMILGESFGLRSPVGALGDPVYAECRTTPGHRLVIPGSIEERAVFVVEGSVSIEGRVFGPGELIVFEAESEALVESKTVSHYMIMGGPRLEKPRLMYWNFVSTSPELIESAKEKWSKKLFDPVPNDTGYVPLPKGF